VTPNEYAENGRCSVIDHFVSLVENWCSEKLVSLLGFRVGESERRSPLIKAMVLVRAAGAVQKARGLPTGSQADERRTSLQLTRKVQKVWPVKTFFRLINPWMARLLSSRLHVVVSFQLMLLEVRGRRSGALYRIPVSFAELDGDFVALTEKSNLWWRNLETGVCEAWIKGVKCQCQVDVIADDTSLVFRDLKALIQHNPLDAPFAGVGLNWRLEPNEADLEAASRRHVVLRLKPVD